jgi:hypothetical protein
LRVVAIFVATQLALVAVGRASFLPAFTPLGQVPYNVKWWLALSTLMARGGPLEVWTPYPPLFPLAHLALFHVAGFDAELLWRFFFLRDPGAAALATAAIHKAQWLWSGMNAILLLALGALIARLASATRGRAEALFAAGAYLLMSQSYASRILVGVVTDQFDYLPCALFMLALVALLRDSPSGSAVSAALGTATKLYPIVLVPLSWLRLQSWRARVRYAAWFGLASALLWLPLLFGGQQPLLSFLRFTEARGGWESVWLYPSKRLPPWPSASHMHGLFDTPFWGRHAIAAPSNPFHLELGSVLGLVTLAALIALFTVARRRVQTPIALVRCALLAVLAILIFTKGFSSYFIQWFFPMLFAVYPAELAALWCGAFLIVGNLEFVGDPGSWPMYWPSLFLRHALLLGLAADQLRRLRAPAVLELATARRDGA